MRTLDLHRVRHADVRDLVDKFIGGLVIENKSRNAEIITGHSDRMKQLVCEVTDEYKLEVYEHEFNKGMLIVKL